MWLPSWASIFLSRYLCRHWYWLFLLLALGFVRLSKGAIFLDVYAFLSRPFWPGPAQKEWIQQGFNLEQQTKLNLLETDNQRLRELLDLKRSLSKDFVSAPVISRSPKGWWQQLELGKGGLDGIRPGHAVIGPGGLLGIVKSVTPTTSRVRLLTAPGSRIGVWIARTKSHGMLIGMGTNRPQLRLFDKDLSVLSGDLVSTSPASTLMPPNLPIGVVQSLDEESLLAPSSAVQLTASPEAIDWVMIQKF